MKKIIKFPSIEQYRTIVKNVISHSEYEGVDENGTNVYNKLKSKPILDFIGTVKLHGTNAGISYNHVSGLWFQSRENIITPQKDNAGFAMAYYSHQDELINMIKNIALVNDLSLHTNTITIYFEWIGKGIQKDVAVSELEKCAVVIGCKVSNFDETVKAYWVNHKDIKNEEIKIFNILDFKLFNISIDFNNPLLSQNEIIDMTISVENECPFGKAFGISNIGEGIVFTCDYKENRYIFKSKGEKHQRSHVKTLNIVDVDKLNIVNEIAKKVTPEWRLNQGIMEVFNILNGGEIDIKKTGDYIRWVISDITKEDLDIISESGFSLKDVSKKISDITKNYLFKQL